VQYVFFEKGIHSVQWVRGKASEAGEFSSIFVLKVTLQSVKKSYRKMGEQDVLVAPPIILLGKQLLPVHPRFPHLWRLWWRC